MFQLKLSVRVKCGKVLYFLPKMTCLSSTLDTAKIDSVIRALHGEYYMGTRISGPYGNLEIIAYVLTWLAWFFPWHITSWHTRKLTCKLTYCKQAKHINIFFSILQNILTAKKQQRPDILSCKYELVWRDWSQDNIKSGQI